MKKWIACLLAAVMVLSLAACGGETPAPTGTNPTNAPAPSEDGSGTVQTAPVGQMRVDMAYTDMAVPALAELQWQEQGEYTVAQTPFDCDADALYRYIQSDDYFTGNYPHISRTVEEDYQISRSDYQGLDIRETITLTNDRGSKIEIVLKWNVNIYTNYQSVSVTTNGVDLTRELQSALCGAFDQAGLDVMRYVVTAKDPDGKGVENGEPLASGDQLQEVIDAGSNVQYLLQRFVSQESPVSGFKACVYGRPTSYNQGYHDSLFTSISTGFTYHFADVVSPDFGGSDPYRVEQLGDRLFSDCSQEYQQTDVRRLVLRKTENNDGTMVYTIAASLYNADYADLQFDLQYTMQGDQVVDSNVAVYFGKSDLSGEGNNKEFLFHQAKQILETLIDGLDAADLVYGNGVDGENTTIWECNVPVEVLGCAIDAQIQVMYEYTYEECIVIIVNQDLHESLGIRG